ncbi:hypothetical protein [Kordia periserrulae]|uniref:hypothetical protein n=1 Tax=Kordia periserrulae TaxID=701523 RepID=UPI0011B1D87B|nr:hypothetical protein [Kordia periserrulae]
MDDVESIAYITMNICVDTDAKVSNIKLVEDKTTYANDTFIEYIRTKLQTVQFKENSDLKNTCFDVSVRFINRKYKEKKLKEDDCSACEKFKEGEFRYGAEEFKDIKVVRKRNIQKEIRKDNVSVFKITWVSNCSYILTYKKTSHPKRKHLVDDEIYVEIIDVLNDDSYVCKITASFTSGIDYGIFKKIKE